ncbi:MAG: hypothetical protein JL57_13880 [Desulfosporosinus sp. BICA1-9]|nr:MAG: hypothetical protein JL57_32145 [Desulfosporosinus sp. BICA1-9]KJS87553.1 MAG: hypothetical protein JL57_13880 [Desulfosporosinus sp. BICA1-9]
MVVDPANFDHPEGKAGFIFWMINIVVTLYKHTFRNRIESKPRVISDKFRILTNRATRPGIKTL